MKKVLYLSNIPVPYRTKFFNEMSKECDLTVIYERNKSTNRDTKWSLSEKGNFKTIFLNGIKIKNENSFSFKIFKYVFSSYDDIIVGCYNSPLQMTAILLMKLFGKKYYINLDGEPFIGSGFKAKLKGFFLKGAKGYLVAGEKSSAKLKELFPNADIYPYYFSSLSNEEIKRNALEKSERKDYVLVVGQYFEYKGLDIALKVAKLNPNLAFKFIGTGNRTEMFLNDFDVYSIKNIEVIPFLQKKELEEEYKRCKALLLPSRQECWGLVINEVASFGTPIVSTYGSGAAVEFLSDKYMDYLAKTCDPQDLSNKLNTLLTSDNDEYTKYLIEKSLNYSIENMVKAHLDALNG